MKNIKVLGLSAVVALSMVVLAACGGGDSKPAAQAPAESKPAATESKPADSKAVPAGVEASITKGTCTACHKIGDKGAPIVGPDLSKIGSKRSAADIVGIMKNPADAKWGLANGAQMPPVSALSDAEMQELANYLAGLK